MTQYEPVIGLEIHAQLLTQSKLFCSCPTSFGESPNQNTCPVCLGLPGALPVINQRAVQLAVRGALALNCEIVNESVFSRKQYFYPDLPKGYQISQFDRPYSKDGWIDIKVGDRVKRAQIERAHMEEDAGKNVHGVSGDSLVDLNRAGTPLIEIVGRPDLYSADEAVEYMRAVRDLLVFIGVNDGNLEEGSFRCDVNISLRPVGTEKLGTRTELKNINSFRFVHKAIEVEIARQTAILDAGGQIEQETRSFDPGTLKTKALRSKANAHDYRYFPEPDLATLYISPAEVEEAKAAMPQLPEQVRERWTNQHGISASAVETLTSHPAYVRFVDEVLARGVDANRAVNLILTEVLRGTTCHGLEAKFPVSAGQIAELCGLVDSKTISGKQAKEVFAAIEGTDLSPEQVVEDRGMKVISDTGALEAVCAAVIESHPGQTAQYRAGKTNIIGFFVGQVMKQTKGSADPATVNEILSKLLA